MAVTAFHPILYVDDPEAERDFYLRFGFETAYEGDEFPGFIAVRAGAAVFGLSSNRTTSGSGRYDAVRWQLIVDDVDEVLRICEADELPFELETEAPSPEHVVRIAKIRSPNGVQIWFEGPNEAVVEEPRPRRSS